MKLLVDAHAPDDFQSIEEARRRKLGAEARLAEMTVENRKTRLRRC